MRPIKFRVWNKKRHQMQQSHNFLIDISDGSLLWQFGHDVPEFLDQDNLILMQFTGLLDRHGKEIYEGDVVIIVSRVDNGYERGVIEWHKDMFHIRSLKYGGLSPGNLRLHYYTQITGGIEILGNIYEHEDLLKRPLD